MDSARKNTPALIGLFLFAAGAAVLSVFNKTVGDLSIYFAYEVLPGQFHYVLSKLVAMFALLALWIQSLAGLVGPSIYRALGLPAASRTHRYFGLLAMGLAVAHILLFTAAVSLRSGHFAFKLFIPNFSGYYQTMVTLGLLAIVFLLIAVVLALCVKKFSAFSRWMHRLGPLALCIILIHAFSIGSETRFWPITALLGIIALSLPVAVVYRIYRSLKADIRGGT